MVDFLFTFVESTWHLVARMAPYLILGFAVAGLLHTLIRPEVVQRFLGKPGLGTALKACFIGVPVPALSYRLQLLCAKMALAVEQLLRLSVQHRKQESTAFWLLTLSWAGLLPQFALQLRSFQEFSLAS